MIDKTARLNPTASVDAKAEIAEQCFIGPGSRLFGYVKADKFVRVDSNVTVYGPAEIGESAYIGPNCILGHPTRRELSKILESGSLESKSVEGKILKVGRGCRIRAGCIIYSDVAVGDEVEFGHNVLVRENVRIGDNSRIGTNVVIDGSCKIGRGVSIQTGAYLCAYSNIEDYVFLGPYCVFTNDKYVMQKRVKLVGPTVRRGASIGANATLMAGIAVGEGAVVGAGSVVTRNVPRRSICFGVPASRRKKIPETWRPILKETDLMRNR